MIKRVYLLFGLLYTGSVSAQHEMHAMEDTTAPMTHAFSLNLPMSRNGSGTGWLPDATPMYGYMVHSKKWMYMFHGNIFGRYTATDLFEAGTRGQDEFDAVSWVMAMGQRRVGAHGLLRLSAMISFDPFFGENGYPLLFQTGETFRGERLVDRQHPHDFFSELSVGYTHELNKRTDLFVYVAFPGEPTLGSVAFMHRVSALYGPDAPLSHHWNDGTHITYGVITAGMRWGNVKLDFSNFTGREPDEDRFNFDRPRFDSFSGRISYNPGANWSLQVSEGFVKSPEWLEPDEDVWRTTASAIFSRPLSGYNFLNVTALWGLNVSHAYEHAVLLEAALVLGRWNTYGRYEWVQKSVYELDLDDPLFDHDELFPINSLLVGFGYDILQTRALRVAVGGQVNGYITPVALRGIYGDYPVSAQAFIRIYPPRMNVPEVMR